MRSPLARRTTSAFGCACAVAEITRSSVSARAARAGLRGIIDRLPGKSGGTIHRLPRLTVAITSCRLYLPLLNGQDQRFGPGDVELVAHLDLFERLLVIHAAAVLPAVGTGEHDRRHRWIDVREGRGNRALTRRGAGQLAFGPDGPARRAVDVL